MVKKIRFSDYLNLFPKAKQHEFGEARKIFSEKNGRVATIEDAAELNEIIAAQKVEKAKKKLPAWMFGHYNHLHNNGYNHFWDND